MRNRVGTWLSLVEHSLGVRGVGSSNLPVPTNLSPTFLISSILVSNRRPRAPQKDAQRRRRCAEKPARGCWLADSAYSAVQIGPSRPISSQFSLKQCSPRLLQKKRRSRCAAAQTRNSRGAYSQIFVTTPRHVSTNALGEGIRRKGTRLSNRCEHLSYRPSPFHL